MNIAIKGGWDFFSRVGLCEVGEFLPGSSWHLGSGAG
jgi:hypothetical protein